MRLLRMSVLLGVTLGVRGVSAQTAGGQPTAAQDGDRTAENDHVALASDDFWSARGSKAE